MDERIEIDAKDLDAKNIELVSANGGPVGIAHQKCTYCGEEPVEFWFKGDPFHFECYVMKKWIERVVFGLIWMKR